MVVLLEFIVEVKNACMRMSLSIDDTGVRPVMGDDPIKKSTSYYVKTEFRIFDEYTSPSFYT